MNIKRLIFDKKSQHKYKNRLNFNYDRYKYF